MKYNQKMTYMFYLARTHVSSQSNSISVVIEGFDVMTHSHVACEYQCSGMVQDTTQSNTMSSSPISSAAPLPEEELLAKETLLHLVAGGSAGKIICYELTLN